MIAARCPCVVSLTQEVPFCAPVWAWAYLFWGALSVLNDDHSSEQDFRDALLTVDDIGQHCPFPAVARRARAIITAIFWRRNPPPPAPPHLPPPGPEAA